MVDTTPDPGYLLQIISICSMIRFLQILIESIRFLFTNLSALELNLGRRKVVEPELLRFDPIQKRFDPIIFFTENELEGDKEKLIDELQFERE